ncbi:MAG TPA: cyanophycinase [Longimicrobiales bacterium]|nr:cyanophycinase [Longimicrobiales bacterium]
MSGSLARSGLPLLCLLLTSLPASAQQRGTLFIVGGGRQPDALVTRFVELAGGPGRARIAVVPMASGAAQESGAGKVEQLVAFGAEAFNLNLSRAQAMTDSAAALLDDVTGVWFVGGDQARLVDALEDTPVLRAIHARYDSGAVLGGTSAGAAIMSDSMLTGSQVAAGEDTIGYHGDEYRRIVRGSIEIVTGFGFLQGAIIDQHFIERERHNRLLSVVLERPSMIGAGIAEGTALEVAPDGRWTVRGRGAVVIYDARDADLTPLASPALGAAGIRMHLLPPGATFDPVSGTARLADTPR